MKYDPDKYEFVEAKLASRNFLEARGGTAPLFLIHREAKDRITLAGAIGRGPSVSGGGTIVGLMFRPRGEATDAQCEALGLHTQPCVQNIMQIYEHELDALDAHTCETCGCTWGDIEGYIDGVKRSEQTHTTRTPYQVKQ